MASNKIYRVEISIHSHNSINLLSLLHKNEEKSDGNINWTKSRSHLIRNFIPLHFRFTVLFEARRDK